MAAPRNRRSTKAESPRFLQPISPRSELRADDSGAEPAAAEVARLSNWTAKAGRGGGGPPSSSPSPPPAPADFDADAYAAEAAASLRERFGLGPVTTRSTLAAPPPHKHVPSSHSYEGGGDAPSDAEGDAVAALQAALAEKTRESERLQELLLAVTPAPGVNANKLAEIQVRWWLCTL
jgi:hypothetical protein